MSQQELLRRVIKALDAAGADYMVTGSLVSSMQGEPRSSHDVDVVVALEQKDVAALVEAFPAPDFYLDEQSIRAAIGGAGAFRQFNLLEPVEGNKVDFWILSDEPYDRERFARRYSDTLDNIPIKISRPEDTILMKLRWAKMSGGSEKQFGDARGVFELQYPRLDLPYMEQWAAQLGVTDLWDRLKREAQTGEEQGGNNPQLRPQ
jgi:hypothetical protein